MFYPSGHIIGRSKYLFVKAIGKGSQNMVRNILPMHGVVVLRQGVPGVESLVAHTAVVGHVQVNFHVSPHLGFVGHGLATSLAQVLTGTTLFVSGYHRVQHCIEV